MKNIISRVKSASDRKGRRLLIVAGLAAMGLGTLAAVNVFDAMADPLPGNPDLSVALDPVSIPKYVTHLVIPPVMKKYGQTDTTDSYQIAVRQFKQQILPVPLPTTTVWSYGPQADPTPTLAPAASSQFNYPAYTIETSANRRVDVRWINGLVKPDGTFLPHLLPVDQTLHWANPPQKCMDSTKQTDCMGNTAAPYTGPVPIVTHVHGAHVDPHSDGYPEAWWLPAASNIAPTYARSGRLFDDATGMNRGNRGYADFSYRNDQPAATLWYHDHALGMTRANVYAGPAGFWLVRGGAYDGAIDKRTNAQAVLPGPAPVAGQGVLALNTPGTQVRNAVREIPIVIQGRSFNRDGSLFYPGNRAFFEGLDPSELQIPFAPDSDVPPIWNPEAFFNVMVVNGRSWPKLEVAQARYRFRLLNGSDARFINLALFVVNPSTGQIDSTKEIPFYQIGADQGFLPQVVRVRTGEQIALTPGMGERDSTPNPDDPRALLMAPAERADVIVDFSRLPNGAVVRMINTAPDSPFGGFPADPADPGTTGQVMQFVVRHALTGAEGSTDGHTTPPAKLILNAEQPLNQPVVTRQVSLNEESSSVVCVMVDPATGDFVIPVVEVPCGSTNSDFFGPTAAKLGTVSVDPTLGDLVGNPLQWTDGTGVNQLVKLKSGVRMTVNVTEAPKRGEIEEWQIANFTEDAHPIHMHLVRFEVVSRTLLDGTPSPNGLLPPGEAGVKDTVIAYPGEITTVRAKFDLAGLYVWHCHILEHEDNEMMRPFVVTDDFQPPHKHDFDGRHDHKMKHEYRWADKHRAK